MRRSPLPDFTQVLGLKGDHLSIARAGSRGNDLYPANPNTTHRDRFKKRNPDRGGGPTLRRQKGASLLRLAPLKQVHGVARGAIVQHASRRATVNDRGRRSPVRSAVDGFGHWSPQPLRSFPWRRDPFVDVPAASAVIAASPRDNLEILVRARASDLFDDFDAVCGEVLR